MFTKHSHSKSEFTRQDFIIYMTKNRVYKILSFKILSNFWFTCQDFNIYSTKNITLYMSNFYYISIFSYFYVSKDER